MSKQFLTAHVAEDAHEFDIFGAISNVKLWPTGTQEHSLVHPVRRCTSIGSHHVAQTAGFGGEIILWDLENLEKLHQIKGQKGTEGTWAVALSPTGDRLAATTCDGKINVWDNTKRKKTLITSPDGHLIASGHENGGVYIFNNLTSKIHHSLHGLVKPVRCVKFSPGGKLSPHAAIHHQQVANLAGHSSWVFSVAWNSIGDHLISGSFDGKVKVWSVDTGSCVATQNEATAAIHTVQSIPRGAGIGEGFVAAGANKSIYYYRESAGE
ncbi:WD40 repeat protein [Tricharina praecox]|uniref:WD40 repeat protein n=1 Tax=Tricharina praecox TaxID=43433 RepID=UPI00222096B0|nr:WD40 repeat protein [Tricharina praecox]KAI5841299.1 WD40 repeat protein [Tricharina praecox]